MHEHRIESSGRLAVVTEHSLHNLLLFNQKSPHNAFTHTATAARTTIGTRDSLVTLGHTRVFAGAKCSNAWELDTTVAAARGLGGFLEVQVHEFTARRLDDASAVGRRVVSQTASVSNTLHHYDRTSKMPRC